MIIPNAFGQRRGTLAVVKCLLGVPMKLLYSAGGIISLLIVISVKLLAVPQELRIAIYLIWGLCLFLFWVFDQYSPSQLGKRAIDQRWKRERHRHQAKAPREVLRLVGGDAEVALRLLRAAQEQYPGKGYKWCVEKVIRDLERDRY